MITVNIGEGILPSGSGAVIQSGLFAHGRINLVVNQGLGSDIRGTIISKGQNLPTITRVAANGVTEVTSAPPIGTIALTDGSILGAPSPSRTRSTKVAAKPSISATQAPIRSSRSRRSTWSAAAAS
jgi:hypothetical protein